MGSISISYAKEDEVAKAKTEIWKYIFGFTEMAAMKCAVELGIPDVLETHGVPMALEELSSLLGCHLSPLHRIMRFLAYHGIFKEVTKGDQEGRIYYTQTPLSRLLVKEGEESMADLFVLYCSPIMLAPYYQLSNQFLIDGAPYEYAHGQDFWKYVATNPAHNKLFNNGMSCTSRLLLPVIVEHCRDVFEEVRTLVDVGGGDGTALGVLVKAFPWIHGINFDLPHVLSNAKPCEGVVSIAGDIFKSIPKADAIFMKWIMHDWGDEECITILKNCRESIPKDTGKVIIADVVIELDDKDKCKQLADAGLIFDIVMMAQTSRGKERTTKEWTYILNGAGFNNRIFQEHRSSSICYCSTSLISCNLFLLVMFIQ